MKQEELEMIIKYQKQSLDYLYRWLAEEVEKDKKPEVFRTDEEAEAINRELDYDHEQQMKEEEGLGHEDDFRPNEEETNQ